MGQESGVAGRTSTLARDKNEENKEAVAEMIKTLGGRWANMEKLPKEQWATITKLQEQLEQHEAATKENKPKLAVARTELDAAVEELEQARRRDPDEEEDEGTGDNAQMTEPVPGPTPQEAQQQ